MVSAEEIECNKNVIALIVSPHNPHLYNCMAKEAIDQIFSRAQQGDVSF